ncbi:MAG TPA: MFS transporter [Pseudonocardiaceae bacterium]
MGERTAATAHGGTERQVGPTTGVRTPAFRRLTAAWVISLVGDGVRMAALPLFTAVFTRDPLAVSAVAIAETLPWLLVAPPAGALVDRLRPRAVVVVTHALRAVLTGVLALAVATGQVSVVLLVVLAFALTAAETFADSASQLLLVELAGPDDLEEANSRFFSAETAGMDLAGPLAASAVFAWEPALCFALDAASFVLAAVLVAGLPDVVPQRDTENESVPLRTRIVEGAGYLVRHPGLRVLVSVVVVSAASASAVNAVSALYAIEELHMPEALVPLLMVAMALGTLGGARVVGILTRRLGEGWSMITGLGLVAAGFGVLGLLHHPVPGALAYLVVGFGVGVWNVLSATRRQRLTPPHMMGRVSSCYRVLAWGLMPLGAGVAGPVAAGFSLSAVFLLAGGLVAVVTLVAGRGLLRTTPEAAPAT